MKNIFLSLLLILQIPGNSSTQDFRNVSFGMSKVEVKTAESADLIADQDNMIVYSDQIASIDVSVVYVFTDGLLTEGMLVSAEKYSNSNQYYEDYLRLKSLLSEKYGKAVNNENWNNTQYKESPANIGTALSLGQVSFLSKWEDDPRIKVSLLLQGKNHKVNLIVKYTNP
ncbi:hypothetical protein [Mangrovibacterium diazotrophicum]|uniref:Uncharacterized protein n=1 Tax=Mangrovibacterium diazotrophicum TaxID=1261403 RepID=A0A419VYL3_9BACT|nr:hypothetical protein [Mangrovibacterium diazotrophicum]RKD88335.1 hypothetical protein BC643_3482 [Mangrovibacterium diazotrophicum]